MNEALKMQISAFVDGELPDNESELLLRRLSQDAALRQQAADYLEIGRLIRQDKDVPGIDRLRGGISAALGEESELPPAEEPETVGSSLMTPASGIAVAATVAAVALIGLGQLSSPVEDSVQNAVAIDLAPAYTEPSAEQVLLNQPSERLLDYRRRHGDSFPEIGSSDILYRMATFEIGPDLEQIEPDGRLAPDEEASEATDAAGDSVDDAAGGQ